MIWSATQSESKGWGKVLSELRTKGLMQQVGRMGGEKSGAGGRAVKALNSRQAEHICKVPEVRKGDGKSLTEKGRSGAWVTLHMPSGSAPC